ncbi:MAG: NAD(P)(+) transhydrogenase (Re/Si-specific) subunit beta [Kiritimatiellae bacterium]|nr:NAD(P)(+) transhydrogenase (Re/Si-specific) subunit beta [Kiritimatiellia bacterium]
MGMPAMLDGATWLRAPAVLLIGGVLLGIRWMASPRTAARGNRLSAACMGGFILLTLAGEGLLASAWVWAALAAGGAIGLALGVRVRMIQIPELVALLNGLGGAASAGVAWLELRAPGAAVEAPAHLAAGLGLVIGAATLGGSLVAAAKLARWLPQRPTRLAGLAAVNAVALMLMLAGVAVTGLPGSGAARGLASPLGLLALGAGAAVVLRVGGADMPVTISLLNSLSGVAAAFAGFALRQFELVAVGGIVGASGLMLTQIMCRAMNRRLGDILSGRTTTAGTAGTTGPSAEVPPDAPANDGASPAPLRARPALPEAVAALRQAARVILVPGYGMAVAQAQHQVKELYDRLEQAGKEVCFAIHPVAGRMPGHMHVLLAEVQMPYEKFLEMETANPLFPSADVAVVIGANDVVNPAANTAVGTPIHGMPVLDAARTRTLVICNLNADPGYAGVRNPLYDREDAILLFGDARQTVGDLARMLSQ